MRYPHVSAFFHGQCWALTQAKFEEIQATLEFLSQGGAFSDEQIRARCGLPKDVEPYFFDAETFMRADAGGAVETTRAGVVAVIPIMGTISHRAEALPAASGGTSTERLSQRFAQAFADPKVKGVVMDINSPGGSVAGTPELAAQIRAARGSKPIVAFANAQAASAAYWLGAQADEFILTPSGEVGSIGVFATHEDQSAAAAAQGVKTTLIADPPAKIEGNPYEPLSEDGATYMQGRVKEYADMFRADVAKGRGVSVEDVRKGFGGGRMLGAKDALAAGMVDRIGSMEDAVRRAGNKRTMAADAEDLSYRARNEAQAVRSRLGLR